MLWCKDSAEPPDQFMGRSLEVEDDIVLLSMVSFRSLGLKRVLRTLYFLTL